MYKILIMLRDGTDPVYEIYRETRINEAGNDTEYVDWTTDVLEELEQKYKELLHIYPAKDLKPFQDMTADIDALISTVGSESSNPDFVTLASGEKLWGIRFERLPESTYALLTDIVVPNTTMIFGCAEEEVVLHDGWYEMQDILMYDVTGTVTTTIPVYVEDSTKAYALFDTEYGTDDQPFILYASEDTELQYALLKDYLGDKIEFYADSEFANLTKGLHKFNPADGYKHVLIQGTVEQMATIYKLYQESKIYALSNQTEAWIKLPESEKVWLISYADIAFKATYGSNSSGNSLFDTLGKQNYVEAGDEVNEL